MTVTFHASDMGGTFRSYTTPLAIMTPDAAAALSWAGGEYKHKIGQRPFCYSWDQSTAKATITSGMAVFNGHVYSLDEQVRFNVSGSDSNACWIAVDRTRTNTFTGTIDGGDYKVVDNQFSLNFGQSVPASTSTVEIIKVRSLKETWGADVYMAPEGSNFAIPTGSFIKFTKTGVVSGVTMRLTSGDNIKTDGAINAPTVAFPATDLGIDATIIDAHKSNNYVWGLIQVKSKLTAGATSNYLPEGWRPAGKVYIQERANRASLQILTDGRFRAANEVDPGYYSFNYMAVGL